MARKGRTKKNALRRRCLKMLLAGWLFISCYPLYGLKVALALLKRCRAVSWPQAFLPSSVFDGQDAPPAMLRIALQAGPLAPQPRWPCPGKRAFQHTLRRFHNFDID